MASNESPCRRAIVVYIACVLASCVQHASVATAPDARRGIDAVAERDAVVAPDAIASAVTLTLTPRSAPFTTHPEVIVHIPPGYSPGPRVDTVVFLHGWRGCAAVVAGGENAPCRDGGPPRFAMSVVDEFDRSGVNALLLVPQLAFDADSSAPGRLGERGGLRALLDEVLAEPRVASVVAGSPGSATLGRVALVAHSGAYVPAALALERGGVDVTDVLLLDALYRDMPQFESWFRAHRAGFLAHASRPRRFSMIYTDAEGTGPASRALWRRCAAALPPGDVDRSAADLTTAEPPPETAYRRSLLVCRTTVRHEDVPRTFLAALLEAWPRDPSRDGGE